MKKVALYDPYLNILGGGERYVLSILKVFESQGYECSIFWSEDISDAINKKLAIQFKHTLRFIPHIFPSSPLKKLRALRIFDYFIYVSDGGYFFSSAKKNYIYAMVPQKSLYSKNLMYRLKTFNYRFLTHSQFTKTRLNMWGIDAKLLYPYVAIPYDISIQKKEKIILTVGRFFTHLHSKRQDLAVQTFKRLKKYPVFQDFRLVLAGGLQKEDEEYFKSLKKLADNDSAIIFNPNISFIKLQELYRRAMYYWHFAGFGIDENQHPELVEHMGIAPVEAMAYGTIPFCYAGGGPKEIIDQGKTGFVFKSERELITEMFDLSKNQKRIRFVQQRAMDFSRKNFGYDVFEKNVKKLFRL